MTDGIRVTTQRLGNGTTFSFPYELLYGERVEVWTSSRRAFWATIVMTAISIAVSFAADAEPYAWAFWGVCAALAGAYYVATRCRQIGFADRSGVLFFLRDRPSAAALESFLAEARDVHATAFGRS